MSANRCAQCGKAQPLLTRPVLRPATADEIHDADILRAQAEDAKERSLWAVAVRLDRRADRLAKSHVFPASDARIVDKNGAPSALDPKTLYHETREPSGARARWHGDDHFCTLRCSEAFALAAYRAGYRRKGG